jgi:L-fuconolactonase
MNGEEMAFTFFDAHAHLVADDQTRYPRNPMQRAANAPPRPPGVIGKPGGYHGPNPVNEVPDTDRVLRWMQEESVDGMVIVQKRMIYRYDNSYILDCAQQHPDLFRPVVMLDPLDASTPDLVRQYTRSHGLAGLRLFGGREADGSMPWLNSEASHLAWAALQEYGLVMNIEVLSQGGGGPSIPAIIDMARCYPDVRIVLDHLLEPESHGRNDFGLDHRYEKLALEENVYLKYTSINLDLCFAEDVPADKMLRRAVDIFGAPRLMWGSSLGTSSGTYRNMLERLRDASLLLADDEKQSLFHDTARRVFIKGGLKAT